MIGKAAKHDVLLQPLRHCVLGVFVAQFVQLFAPLFFLLGGEVFVFPWICEPLTEKLLFAKGELLQSKAVVSILVDAAVSIRFGSGGLSVL